MTKSFQTASACVCVCAFVSARALNRLITVMHEQSPRLRQEIQEAAFRFKLENIITEKGKMKANITDQFAAAPASPQILTRAKLFWDFKRRRSEMQEEFSASANSSV